MHGRPCRRPHLFLSSYSAGGACVLKCFNRTTTHKGRIMNLSLSIGPVVSLIAGILILLIPRLLNYIVAIYLIVIGLIGLFGVGSLKL
jgi:hypothetical protein